MFDLDFIFYCHCFVSKVQKIILKSTKNYEIAACVGRMHVDHLRKRGLFLFVAFIIFWRACNLIPATVFTIIKGPVLKCFMAVVCVRLKIVFDVIGEV